jgi:hypothetical protein
MAVTVPPGFIAATIEVDDDREVRVFVRRIAPGRVAALRGLLVQAEAHAAAQDHFRPAPNPHAEALRAAVASDVLFADDRNELWLRSGHQPQLLAALLAANAAILA